MMREAEWFIAGYIALVAVVVAFVFYMAHWSDERERDCIREHGPKVVVVQGKGGDYTATVCDD